MMKIYDISTSVAYYISTDRTQKENKILWRSFVCKFATWKMLKADKNKNIILVA